MKIGFIGLGVMGQPMALNLARAGVELIVWNRTSGRCVPVVDVGAEMAESVTDVYRQAQVVILMMATSDALDIVLGRATDSFAKNVADHTIVHMGTTSAEYSHNLEGDILAHGGRYVEAPVSGSREPAEAGKLVAMLAGDVADVNIVRPIVKPMCRELVECGPVPNALLMKLSVNTFLIPMVTALAEASHLARRFGLDMNKFQEILDAGPMSSVVSRGKVDKLVTENFEVQASISDVLKNNRLAIEAARNASLASPLMDACLNLYSETVDLGYSRSDMATVVRAIEARTDGYHNH